MNTANSQVLLPIAIAADTVAAERLLAQCWELFSDFANWKQWLPESSHVIQLDDGKPGRGSRLRLKLASVDDVWLISYWNAGKCVHLQADTKYIRIAHSFEFQITAAHSIELKLGVECEIHGPYRLLGSFFQGRRTRQLRQIGDRLQKWLRTGLK